MKEGTPRRGPKHVTKLANWVVRPPLGTARGPALGSRYPDDETTCNPNSPNLR